MKKIRSISAIILVSLLISLLIIPASASGDSAAVSADYSYVEYNGNKYVRVNNDTIYSLGTSNLVYQIEFKGGDSMISYSALKANESAAELSIEYKTGGYVYYYYVNETKLEHFNTYIQNGGDSTLAISFHMTTVSSDRNDFFASELVISGYELNYYSMEGDVFSPVFNKDINILTGYLISDEDGSFYYVDYLRSSDGSGASLDMQKEVKIWKITDKELIEMLTEALNEGYYDGDLSPDDFDDTEGGLATGIILLSVILGMIPLVGAIVFFAFSIKCDKEYKRRLRLISAICLSAVVITLITVIVCLTNAVV